MEDSNIVETDLTQITNIMELKAYKSDQYDILSDAHRKIHIAEMNIQAINTRITQLQHERAQDIVDIIPQLGSSS